MQTIKRIISLVLLGTLLPIISACGGQTTPDTSASGMVEVLDAAETLSLGEATTEYTTGLQDISFSQGESIGAISCAGDTVYVELYRYGEDDTVQTRICRLEPEGGLTDLVQENALISYLLALADGSLWYSRTDWQSETIRTTLVHVDDGGSELAAVDYDLEADGLLPAQNGGVAVWGYNGVTVYDSVGQTTGTVTTGSGTVSSMAVLDDGSLVGILTLDPLNSEERQLVRLNLDTMAFDTVADLGDIGSEGILGGTLNQLIFLSGGDILSYDVDTQEVTTALSWSGAGVTQDGSYCAALLQGNYMVFSVTQSSGQKLYILPLGYTLNSAEKTTLTLAGVQISQAVQELVVAFNQASDAYYVEIQDYYPTNDFEAGAERFLYDISIGQLPDMILFSSTADGPEAEDLVRKGYLTDLDSLLAEDDTLQRSDFLENILDAVSVDGTLYTIPLEFAIETAGVSTSIAGDIAGYTLEDLIQWVRENPDKEVLSDGGRTDLLQSILKADGENLLDENYRLDTQGLTELLRFANSVPDNIETYYNGGSILVAAGEYETGRAADFVSSRLGEGNDFVLAGFPSASQNGSYLEVYRQLGIASNTEHREGCWAFLSYFLSYAYQTQFLDSTATIFNLSLRQDILAEQEQELLTRWEYPQNWIDQTDALIRTVDHVAAPSGMIDIIMEEAEAYFAGDKTLETTVQNIQSRVSIYLAEKG
jgi:ABC-type glycerol-3-phosphate transport system substrate-binding protein